MEGDIQLGGCGAILLAAGVAQTVKNIVPDADVVVVDVVAVVVFVVESFVELKKKTKKNIKIYLS